MPLLRAALCAAEDQPPEADHGVDHKVPLLGQQPIAALAHLLELVVLDLHNEPALLEDRCGMDEARRWYAGSTVALARLPLLDADADGLTKLAPPHLDALRPLGRPGLLTETIAVLSGLGCRPEDLVRVRVRTRARVRVRAEGEGEDEGEGEGEGQVGSRAGEGEGRVQAW